MWCFKHNSTKFTLASLGIVPKFSTECCPLKQNITSPCCPVSLMNSTSPKPSCPLKNSTSCCITVYIYTVILLPFLKGTPSQMVHECAYRMAKSIHCSEDLYQDYLHYSKSWQSLIISTECCPLKQNITSPCCPVSLMNSTSPKPSCPLKNSTSCCITVYIYTVILLPFLKGTPSQMVHECAYRMAKSIHCSEDLYQDYLHYSKSWQSLIIYIYIHYIFKGNTEGHP